MRAWFAVSLIALATVGCKRANNQYCDAETPCESGTCDDDTNECRPSVADAGVDAAVCGGDSECTTPTSPICDDTSGLCRGCASGGECLAKDTATPECDDDGRCVECLVSSACEEATPICSDGSCSLCTAHTECADRDADKPKCADDGTCVQCTDHGDCASGVCDRTMNACVDASAIIYVDTGGSDDTGCGDVGDECRTISFALDEVAAGRSTLSVAAGTYGETALADNVDALIVGPRSAIVNVPFSDQAAMLLVNGSHITVDGLTLRGAFGNSDADGMRCSSGSSFTAMGTLITTNDSSGIDARNGCVVNLDQVEVLNNTVRGVFMDGGELVVHRSLIKDNEGGGIEIQDSSFEIVNNFIILNGNSAGGGSLFGGVRITLSGSEASMKFEFNTVAENQSGSGLDEPGVFCFADMTASNNIVYGSGGDHVGGTCAWTYSDIKGGETGTGNMDTDPEFLDISSENYHLDPASPVKDLADPAATLMVDFDGEARGVGGRSDIGADELQ